MTIPTHVPYSIENEEAVIGSILMNPDAILKAGSILAPDDFYREKHGWIFEAALWLDERNAPIDILSLADRLEDMGRLDEIGGMSAINELMFRAPNSLQVEYYAGLVLNDAELRRRLGISQEGAKLAYRPGMTVEEWDTEIDKQLNEARKRSTKEEDSHIRTALDELTDQIEAMRETGLPPGTPTASKDITRLLGGWRPGSYVVLAARTSMGKTSRALWECLHAAKQGYNCQFFTYEMGRAPLSGRLVAAHGGIQQDSIFNQAMNDDEYHRYLSAVDEVRQLPIWIEKRPGDFFELRRRAWQRAMKTGKLDLIIVDYLQIMPPMNGRGNANANRVQIVGDNSQGLQQLAQELNCCVIALSQLSRACEQREDKRPLLSDLRESGQIEQDADIVMFIYRDEVYNPNTEKPGIAELIVAKHRNGALGTTEQRVNLGMGRWHDVSYIWQEEQEASAPPPPSYSNGWY